MASFLPGSPGGKGCGSIPSWTETIQNLKRETCWFQGFEFWNPLVTSCNSLSPAASGFDSHGLDPISAGRKRVPWLKKNRKKRNEGKVEAVPAKNMSFKTCFCLAKWICLVHHLKTTDLFFLWKASAIVIDMSCPLTFRTILCELAQLVIQSKSTHHLPICWSFCCLRVLPILAWRSWK